jgi:hypothetical protein
MPSVSGALVEEHLASSIADRWKKRSAIRLQTSAHMEGIQIYLNLL